jgi:hypothetical protein
LQEGCDVLIIKKTPYMFAGSLRLKIKQNYMVLYRFEPSSQPDSRRALTAGVLLAIPPSLAIPIHKPIPNAITRSNGPMPQKPGSNDPVSVFVTLKKIILMINPMAKLIRRDIVICLSRFSRQDLQQGIRIDFYISSQIPGRKNQLFR